jgi:hypothetical protein
MLSVVTQAATAWLLAADQHSIVRWSATLKAFALSR